METFTYLKERRRFGRQCLFSEQNKVQESILPNAADSKNYILKNPVDNGMQLSEQFALSEMNTENPEYISKGINHYEGGWPKDINMLDEEQTMRHRKKIEREDQYPIQMNHLLEPMLHLVNINNAVNLFEDYFEDKAPIFNRVTLSGRTIQCFKFPSENEKTYANHVCFSPEGGEEMAVAYSRTQYQDKQMADTSSYIWKMDNPQKPLVMLNCQAAATTVEYNLRDGRLLAGGFINGKVCVWDSRNGGDPSMITEIESSHRTRVNSLLWLHSKSNAEFYSGSADGQVYFWDIRKFTEPIDSLCCDPVRSETQDLHRSFGVSVLEFEPTIPTKYLIGTEEGWVFVGNRKGTTIAEKLPTRTSGNDGPVRSLERNPTFVKNFMTIGEFRVKIFSDECNDNPIIWVPNQEHELTCGCWSRIRCSLLFAGRFDGLVDFWDLLVDLGKPIVSIKVTQHSICHMRAHENGAWLSVGDTNGDVYVVELSPSLTYTDRNEKALLSAMFEREAKREKILEARMREIRLKEKLDMDMEEKARKQLEKKSKSTTSSTTLKASTSAVEEGIKSKSSSVRTKTSSIKSGINGPLEYQNEVKQTKLFFREMNREEQARRDAKNPNPIFE